MTREGKSVFETFRTLLIEWLENSHLFPESNLHIDVIFNPHAGALKSKHQSRALVAALQSAKAALEPAERPKRLLRVSAWNTEYPGHEKAILTHLQAEDPLLQPGDNRLVVTAGGDGTSRGVLISAITLEPRLLENLFFFRLPLGTGNDAAETRDWKLALDALSGRGRLSVQVKPLPVLEVRVPGQAPHYSFNIASVGLDAFVAHLTNHMKAWFPGNSYGLMVDLTAFFYEAFVKVVPTHLELSHDGKRVLEWHESFLLAAMGTTGHKTYGAGKKVLPDSDNFCIAGKRNLFSKLAYRKPFYEGTHRGLDGITLASGNALTVTSPVRVPLQMDGEVLWLEPGDFPVTLSIADRGLQILKLAGSDFVL